MRVRGPTIAATLYVGVSGPMCPCMSGHPAKPHTPCPFAACGPVPFREPVNWRELGLDDYPKVRSARVARALCCATPCIAVDPHPFVSPNLTPGLFRAVDRQKADGSERRQSEADERTVSERGENAQRLLPVEVACRLRAPRVACVGEANGPPTGHRVLCRGVLRRAASCCC